MSSASLNIGATGLTPAPIPNGHALVLQVGDQFVVVNHPTGMEYWVCFHTDVQQTTAAVKDEHGRSWANLGKVLIAVMTIPAGSPAPTQMLAYDAAGNLQEEVPVGSVFQLPYTIGAEFDGVSGAGPGTDLTQDIRAAAGIRVVATSGFIGLPQAKPITVLNSPAALNTVTMFANRGPGADHQYWWSLDLVDAVAVTQAVTWDGTYTGRRFGWANYVKGNTP